MITSDVSNRSAKMDNFEGLEDIIGQLPMLKTYLHFCTGFANPHGTPTCPDTIIASIEKAAVKLTAAFPWLAGQVINRGHAEGVTGTFSVAKCPSFQGTFLRRVRDCRNLCPSYPEILAARASLRVLDGSVLSVMTAFPLSYEESASNPAPVVALQVSLVRGGILMDWAAQHNVMDSAGLAQCMRLFACVLSGHDLPPAALDWGNRDRRDMIRPLGPGETVMEHAHLRRAPIPGGRALPLSSATFAAFEWCDFHVSAKSLAALKSLATRELETLAQQQDHGTGTATATPPYVSTNDALTALCWQRIAAARIQLGRPAGQVSKIARAFDVRRLMGVPAEHMGHMIYIAATKMTLGDLGGRGSRESQESSGLGRIAAALRGDLAAASSELEVRSFVTLVARTRDRSTISFSGEFDPAVDVGTSSCFAIKYAYEYGPELGMPDFMTRPRFTPLPSTVYVMPELREGGTHVMMSLRPDEIEIIKRDEMWSRYAECLA